MATLSVGLPNFGDWTGVVGLAGGLEAVGVHRVVVTDHVVMGRHTENYVWGRFPTPPDGDWLEPLTLLSSIAATTTSIRLSTGILIAPLRPAPLLAKQVSTLDALSKGRVDLGVGTGWQSEEYAALGLDFSRRGELLTDTIAACRALWADSPAQHRGPAADFADVFCSPKPAQQRLPIWFSGTLHRRNMARIVQLGDGWIPIMNSTTEQIIDGAAALRKEFAAAGRDPATLSVQAALPVLRRDNGIDLDATVDESRPLIDGGVTDLTVHVRALAREASVAVGLAGEFVKRLAV